MLFISAYSVATGVKQRIPAHWLDHPVLGRQFRKTPRQAATETSSPFDAFTVDQLKEHAAEHDIDVSGLTRKADLVAAITTHQMAPSAEKE